MEEKKKVLSREQTVGTPNLGKKKMKNQILLSQPRENGVWNSLQSSLYKTQQFIFRCSPIIGNETTLVTVAVQSVDISTLAQLLGGSQKSWRFAKLLFVLSQAANTLWSCDWKSHSITMQFLLQLYCYFTLKNIKNRFLRVLWAR